MPDLASAAAGAALVASARRGRRFAIFAWGVLAYNLSVVLWGAYVRATGSGAGCGNHWPLCNGPLTLQTPVGATIIEFTHRVSSGIDLALVAALVVWAHRAYPKRHQVRLGATLSAIFLVTEALLGAALVLLNHVARNASSSRAWSLSAHLINTLTLLASLALTAWWSSGRPAVRLRGRPAWMAAATLAVFAVLGVSGAIAALGDTLFPAGSLAAGFARDFDPSANLFVRLRVWHPLIAGGASVWVLYYALAAVPAFAAGSVGRRLSYAVLALLGCQLAAGAINLLLLAPVGMQLVHLMLADLLWIALVLLSAERLRA
ncbi:MAG: COX15/CtaA family protein [Bryobacteraceae bacterium]